MTEKNEYASVVYTPSELIEYQDASVVSKTLIKKPSGTITVFAFDAGQELSTHSAPFDAMVQCIDGEGLITISGVDYTVKPGEMIILPADEPHGVKAEKRFKMMLSMVKG